MTTQTITLALVAIVVTIFLWIRYIKKTIHKKSFNSFRYALYRAELAIITVYIKGEPVHMLVDTGSSLSYLDASVAKEFNVETYSKDTNIKALNSTTKSTQACVLPFKSNDIEYTQEFLILDLQESVKDIYEDSGIRIQGVLGNNFISRNKLIIDFDKLGVYMP